METSAPDKPARRRFLLYLLALGGAVWPAAARFARGPSSRSRSPRAAIDRADLAVSALAADFVRSQPDRARRIARAVAARLSPGEPTDSPARRIAVARESLLRAERVDAELAAGVVLLLDGWVLARSEAEFAIYARVESGA